NAGRIEQIGTGRDLYERPGSRFVASFIGNSNFLDGRLSRSDQSIVLPDGTALRELALDRVDALQDKVSLMIRPDHLRLGEAGDGAPRLRGTVTGATYLGEYMQLSVATAWGAVLSMRVAPDAGRAMPAPGSEITMSCRATDVKVF
ncbi:MAG: TOBE domain-containing protein, partial [Pseudomonadota bacterium]|nr:TOBE domain-containing protein [Pseudomonadota bacterium]